MLPGSGAGGGGLRFNLLGFPTRVDWSFFLIAAVITLGSGGDLDRSLLWVAIVAGSVLAHELGHAVAARHYGATPQITLHAMGGLTSFVPPEPPTRRESVTVSVAGPAAGFAVGGLVILGRMVLDPADGSVVDDGITMAAFVNLGWGAVNLVPVLPLDGGAILRELLPGEPAVRLRRAARISVAVGVAAVVGAFAADLRFAAVLFALFTFSNVALAGWGRRAATDDRLSDAFDRLRNGDIEALSPAQRELAQIPEPRRRAVLASAVADMLIARGALVEARSHVERFETDIDPALRLLVATYEGDPAAPDQLLRHVVAHPSPLGARCLARGFIRAGRALDLLRVLVEGPPKLRRLAVLREVHLLLHVAGAVEVARRVGDLMLAEHPDAEAATWFNVACSHSRAGAVDDAVRALSSAIDRGWSDSGQLDADPDLADLRRHPAFPALRHRISR